MGGKNRNTKGPVERRIDPRDGKAYTHREFSDYYGPSAEREWKMASKVPAAVEAFQRTDDEHGSQGSSPSNSPPKAEVGSSAPSQPHSDGTDDLNERELQRLSAELRNANQAHEEALMKIKDEEAKIAKLEAELQEQQATSEAALKKMQDELKRKQTELDEQNADMKEESAKATLSERKLQQLTCDLEAAHSRIATLEQQLSKRELLSPKTSQTLEKLKMRIAACAQVIANTLHNWAETGYQKISAHPFVERQLQAAKHIAEDIWTKPSVVSARQLAFDAWQDPKKHIEYGVQRLEKTHYGGKVKKVALDVTSQPEVKSAVKNCKEEWQKDEGIHIKAIAITVFFISAMVDLIYKALPSQVQLVVDDCTKTWNEAQGMQKFTATAAVIFAYLSCASKAALAKAKAATTRSRSDEAPQQTV